MIGNGDSPSSLSKSKRENIVFVLPNLLTTLNLFLGFYAIIYATRGEWSLAAYAILLASFTDGLDGRVARLTNTQSRFGEQYDSMSDLVSFGAAPALLMYLFALYPYGRLGWLAAFFFLTCAALRLARFNVLKQTEEKRYFKGCPSPVAAGTVSAAVLFYLHMVDRSQLTKDIFVLIVMFILAAVMVSNIRFRSFKDLSFRSQKGFGYLLIVVAALMVVVSSPEKILFPICTLYIFSGPLGELYRLFKKRKHV